MISSILNNGRFEIDIKYTKRAQHAIEIARSNVANFDVIAAVGGDGSVNEIGKSLINTETKLAIIPAGSGNGLARDLNIPMNIKKAIMLLNKGHNKRIDAIKINEEHFFVTAGVAFDAHVSWKFSESKKRGFWTYFKISFSSFFTYKPQDYKVYYNGVEKTISNGFLVTLSNSKQYGNNILISPNSELDDGKVKLISIKKFPLFYLPIFGYYLLTKQIHKFKFTNEISSDNITLINPNQKLHIDGEPIKMDKTLVIEVIPKSLNVIVP